MALYDDVVVFDHATKLAYVIAWVHLSDHPDADAAYKVTYLWSHLLEWVPRSALQSRLTTRSTPGSLQLQPHWQQRQLHACQARQMMHMCLCRHCNSQAGRRRLERLVARITEGRGGAVLPPGRVSLSLSRRPQPPGASNFTEEQFLDRVRATQVGRIHVV